jgi:hypothetical protein
MFFHEGILSLSSRDKLAIFIGLIVVAGFGSIMDTIQKDCQQNIRIFFCVLAKLIVFLNGFSSSSTGVL